MKVLVTGGAGFIGSNLVDRLLEEGNEVVCLDNFSDFYDPSIKKNNILNALSFNSYTLVKGDILDKDILDRIFTKEFDAVVHLAACAGVRPSIKRPHIYQRVNVEGTVNLLEGCEKFNIPKFIFASSSSVYGGRTSVPFRETDDVNKPISPYAATKLSGEVISYTYYHLFGINVHALRFFTVYGPRQRPEMAIHLFAHHMQNGEPITVFGRGESARDYTYIDDIVDGILSSIKNCKGYEIINIGGSNTTSLEDLIQILTVRLGVNPVIEYLPDQPGDVPITFADISRAKKILGYSPKIDIQKGIDLFCTWFEEQMKNRDPQEELSMPSLTP